ncbi:amidohydrolase [Rhodococcoides yunnanense]|uniref:amidohydrolase n=1 Tax=Rhodococcoides yunnanense TaxID=278209 RepID=UPI0009341358|nr:amidohydrolase [Rhodococcus yunnanensis]
MTVDTTVAMLDARLEASVRAGIERHADLLVDISHRIHASPELRFEEFAASALLADTLEANGFRVDRGVAGLPTAFVGEFGSTADGPTVAFFLEYDALEEIGHGCGHNVIAAMGLGAAVIAKEWMEEQKSPCGRILVVGSPGEEGGGGKNHLIDGGIIDDIDAAMLIHPSGENISGMRTLGRVALEFDFEGKAAHAAVSPHLGLNALDATVLTLNAIGLLRQQLPTDARVHTIVTNGGQATNVIPEHSTIRAYIRAEDTEYLVDQLQPRIENCARGAALATGTTVTITTQSPTYAALAPNPVLADLIESNFRRVGREVESLRGEVFPGSTDMGNVSQLVPSIQPNIEFEPGLGMHNREAAALAGGPVGDRAVRDGAQIMAMTALQLFSTPSLIADVRAAFDLGVKVGL